MKFKNQEIISIKVLEIANYRPFQYLYSIWKTSIQGFQFFIEMLE